MAENEFIANFMTGFNLKPKMLNRYPTRDDLKKELDQKVYDVANTQGIEEAYKLKEAREGMLRNYDLLSEYEDQRQKDLKQAKQYGQAYNEKEQAEYTQALLSFQDEFPELRNTITNVREVGPAGFQPSFFEGGLDFANPPDNKYGKSLNDGIKQGSKAAIDQKQGLLSQQQPPQEQGFFGNIGEYINEDFLGRVLAIMARPEAFTDPRGLGAGIARAGQAVFAQEKEQAAAKAKTQLEYDKIKADLQKEAIKAGTPTKLTDTMLEVVDRTVAGNKAMSSIGKIRDILAGPGAGGLAGTIENYLADLGGLVRANPGETKDNIIRRLQSLLTSQVADTLGFGKDMSPMERELLKNVIPQPDAFTDTNRLKDSLDTLESFIQGKLVSSKLLAQRYGFGDIVDQAANPPSSIIATIK